MDGMSRERGREVRWKMKCRGSNAEVNLEVCLLGDGGEDGIRRVAGKCVYNKRHAGGEGGLLNSN